ncbi:serine hydrolase FSH [Gaertneriomyces semiglobifer]|nr:serine hydrolase FSH [Gaertneriomyces semiglobifer]
MTAPSKLRILCLHGYTQNASVYRRRTAVVAKDMKNIADFVYIDAPHILPKKQSSGEGETESNLRQSDDETQRAWWTADDSHTVYSGVDESISHVQKIWESSGPFHGILGFSQGAAFAAYLLHASLLSPPPKFSILISGFIPRSDHAAVFATPLTMPSLHVIGRQDQWVLPERSEALTETFEKAEVVWHDGGHFLPTGAEWRRTYRDWVDGMARAVEKESATEGSPNEA